MSLHKFGFTSKNSQSTDEPKKSKGREESKRNYEKEKRVRKFLQKWKDEFPWLAYDSDTNKMSCTPCKSFESEGRFVLGTDQEANSKPQPKI